VRLVPRKWPNLRSGMAGAVLLIVVFAAQDWREDGARDGFITGLAIAAASAAVIGTLWLIGRDRQRRHPS